MIGSDSRMIIGETIVDEDADGGEALRQHDGRQVEARLEICQAMVETPVGGVEELAIIGLGAEDGDPHDDYLPTASMTRSDPARPAA